ncbi:helix-turn-helix domain-containing protein [Limosilactobacillus fermentum]|uniref:helix-turn-helix domain-containing protein n=1 Tax=Limosilactobacillus fermentum TaxID=1613 RepID=UPI001C0AF7C0|nr:helix-turn-helix transcriptional regulator [Limosilactobacillus fermentum]QWQ33154.1 helix-turn-helix domain-containing protein [Limosilactobacillus fermentum]
MTTFERIRELAKKRGLTLKQVAIKAGLSENAIYRYNQGIEPKLPTLMAIADVLGVSVNYLLGKDDTPEWATEKDTLDLEDFLDGNLKVNMAYGGKDLTDEEIERLKIAMTQIFWDKRRQEK